MSSKNRMSVRILGQDHYLITTDDQQYVENVARLVDDRMQAILKSNSSLSYTKIAILTALNLADDLMKTRLDLESISPEQKMPQGDIEETKKQITSLTQNVADAEGLYDNILVEFERIKSTRSDQETQLKKLVNQIETMCGDLVSGDEALEKATNRIADLEEKLLLRESEITEYIKVFDEIETDNLRESILQDDFDDEIIYEEDLEK